MSEPNVRTNDGRSPRLLGAVLLGLLAVGCHDTIKAEKPNPKSTGGPIPVQPQQGQAENPAPKFAGGAIPVPPQQGAPWSPPETKLPKFLVTATAALFEQGVADPRGCEYREVEVGEWKLIKTHGFVLPERPGEAGRFVVGWDGVVRPAFSVGGAADLEADVREVAGSLKKGKGNEAVESGVVTVGISGPGKFEPTETRAGTFFGAGEPMSVAGHSPLKLCILLRLGRADLAEALFTGGTPWTAATPRGDLTDYGINYLTLANDWARVVYSRLLSAHQRGEDVVALDAARRLDAFRKAVDIRAEAMGFVREESRRYSRAVSVSKAYLQDIILLDPLLADQERRAKEPPHGPIPKRGGDPSARIAALIHDLDQIHASGRGMGSMYGEDPYRDPIVLDLIAEGEPAVEPLIAALATDSRLTRSLSGRGMMPLQVNTVSSLIYRALLTLLKTNSTLSGGSDFSELQTPEGKKRLAVAVRSFWEKNRAVPLLERWYRDLADDSAGASRWQAAAGGLIQPVGPGGTNYLMSVGLGRPARLAPGQPRNGDALRGRTPSITELLTRRAEIAETGPSRSIPDVNLLQASVFGLYLISWDERASLPTIKALMKTNIQRSLDARQQNDGQIYYHYIASFAMARARAGEREALDEYAAWARTIKPKRVQYEWRVVLVPFWTYPDHPSIAEAARAMFLDPKSPWLPLIPRTSAGLDMPDDHLIVSPLLANPAFREAILDALTDKTTIGTVRRQSDGAVQLSLTSGRWDSFLETRSLEPGEKVGVELNFRARDYIAWKLSELDGAPECWLSWPEGRRDQAVDACAAYIRRYGPRFSAEAPYKEDDAPQFPHAHLRFPILAKPATVDDVREARAIFSLEGEGESRVVALASGFPVLARWLALKDAPLDMRTGDFMSGKRNLQDGWIWQAEERVKDGKTERFYGFVGPATIARVPAEEIEFPPGQSGGSRLKGGLEARLSQADSAGAALAPGRPIALTLHLRNGLGVERAVPTEFLRPGKDGKPASRRGVSLVLAKLPKEARRPDRFDLAHSPAPETTRSNPFDPGDARRPLAPTESFEAMSIDLNDWFAGLEPGYYRFHLKFEAVSGVGEGMTNQVFFTIDDPVDPIR